MTAKKKANGKKKPSNRNKKETKPKFSGKIKKGEVRNPVGRLPGTKNKSTVQVKEALTAAFDNIGGILGFSTWAAANRTEFYRLYAKLLPRQITGEGGGPVTFAEIRRTIIDPAYDGTLTRKEYEDQLATPVLIDQKTGTEG